MICMFQSKNTVQFNALERKSFSRKTTIYIVTRAKREWLAEKAVEAETPCRCGNCRKVGCNCERTVGQDNCMAVRLLKSEHG